MVLSPGEIGFVCEADWRTVSEVGNRSTGYCPATTRERTIVREDDFVCVFRGSDLPRT